MKKSKKALFLFPSLICNLINLVLLVRYFPFSTIQNFSFEFDVDLILRQSVALTVFGSVLMQLFFAASVYYYCRRSNTNAIFAANVASVLYLLLTMYVYFTPLDTSSFIIFYSLYYLIMLSISYLISNRQIYNFLWVYPIVFFVFPLISLFLYHIVVSVLYLI